MKIHKSLILVLRPATMSRDGFLSSTDQETAHHLQHRAGLMDESIFMLSSLNAIT